MAEWLKLMLEPVLGFYDEYALAGTALRQFGDQPTYRIPLLPRDISVREVYAMTQYFADK